jgi:hypothetical protein
MSYTAVIKVRTLSDGIVEVDNSLLTPCVLRTSTGAWRVRGGGPTQRYSTLAQAERGEHARLVCGDLLRAHPRARRASQDQPHHPKQRPDMRSFITRTLTRALAAAHITMHTSREPGLLPVGVEPPGWAWHDPEMGAVAHDITWHSGHVSSSATVCDLYLADASLLLTVITPAHQQAHNLAEIGTAAYAPGDRSP